MANGDSPSAYQRLSLAHSIILCIEVLAKHLKPVFDKLKPNQKDIKTEWENAFTQLLGDIIPIACAFSRELRDNSGSGSANTAHKKFSLHETIASARPLLDVVKVLGSFYSLAGTLCGVVGPGKALPQLNVSYCNSITITIYSYFLFIIGFDKRIIDDI